ncbi:prion-like-(Q/N-rich) domain-bearing protein 25 [Microplitis mediator]|uniref:prion-like-(Q/N-rich) domain-bearing protein 25 n=1 Tax=Microplitis mediator TaxID=375433 RepID=UPI0025525401|nr:prion-like-(Q/N-rich) domain-bearing protein 25 [Microplitis mediator]
MLTETKYLILIVALTLIARFARSTDKNIDDCKHNSDTCDPYLAQPCCEKSDVCQRGITKITFYCMEADILGRSCEIDLDCYKISNAICSKNKCVCKSNYVPHENDTTCLPLLGANCESYEKCVPHNSICEDGQYFLGQSCQNDEDCRRIMYAECSGDNKCSCRFEYVEKDQSTCRPLLHSFCETSEECLTNNSACIDNHCQCKGDFAPQSYDRCSPTYFDSKVHVNGKVFCPRNHIALNETICAPLLNGLCMTSEFCVVENSACINSKCQCKPKYVARIDNNCLPTYLQGSCNHDFDCYKIWAAECLNNKCVCKNNYISLNETTCSVPIGGMCTTNKVCRVENSICIDNKCQCSPYYDSVSNNECKPVNYKYCVTNDDCMDKPHKECAQNKECVCKTNYIMINESSVVYCNELIDCGDPWHAKCSINHNCLCNSNTTQYNRATCLPLIGGACWKDGQCIVANSSCIDYHCQCNSPNYVYAANNICAPSQYDH